MDAREQFGGQQVGDIPVGTAGAGRGTEDLKKGRMKEEVLWGEG